MFTLTSRRTRVHDLFATCVRNTILKNNTMPLALAEAGAVGLVGEKTKAGGFETTRG